LLPQIYAPVTARYYDYQIMNLNDDEGSSRRIAFSARTEFTLKD